MKISMAKKILKSEEKFNITPRSLAAWMNLEFPDQTATGPTWRKRLDVARELVNDYNQQLELDLQKRLDQGVELVPSSEHLGLHELPDGPDYPDDLDGDWDADEDMPRD